MFLFLTFLEKIWSSYAGELLTSKSKDYIYGSMNFITNIKNPLSFQENLKVFKNVASMSLQNCVPDVLVGLPALRAIYIISITQSKNCRESN